MKKLILLITIIFGCFNSFGQGWNSTLTPISEPTLEKMDLFTNKDGNHLLIKRSNGNIVYYNFNSQGQVNTGKTITLQTSGDFPTITGSNDVVYAIYKTGNVIRVKHSTNGGTSWLSSISDRSTTANLCNGIDAIYELGQGVHLVWATQDNNSDFETYYWRLTPPPYQWTENKNVTDDTQYEVGGAPTVNYSQGRVHVSYNLKAGVQTWSAAKTRDRYNGVWQTPQFISTVDESMAERLEVRENNLYAVYSKFFIEYPNVYFHLAYKSRTLSGTWSSSEGTIIDYAILEDPTSFNLCKTYDEKLQVVYVDVTGGQSFFHRSFNGSWSGTFTLDGNHNYDLIPKGLTNVSNDVFVTWKIYGDNFIRYRQYDAIPLSPQGLAVSGRDFGQWSHPILTWSFNNEPDVYANDNGYEIQRRTRQVPGNFGNWSTIAYVAGNVKTYNDYDIIIEGTGSLYQAEYKIRAIDVGNNISSWSSTVSIYFGQFGKMNSEMKKFEYQLSQNYPNPFNPTTTISYSIQNAGEVSLKVYDMLGTEVASLVNENQEAGNYSFEYNASDLPSGIYVYRLASGNFMETKKLILLK